MCQYNFDGSRGILVRSIHNGASIFTFILQGWPRMSNVEAELSIGQIKIHTAVNKIRQRTNNKCFKSSEQRN